MCRNLIILICIPAIFAACIPLSSPNKSDTCPVTTPSQQSLLLPIDIEYENRFWYGTPALWTNLPIDGIWQELPHDKDGYVQKVVFWSEDFEALSQPNPALTLSGRRLDDWAPTFSLSDATHGFDETGSFMLIGISIPNEGCWEITTEYRDEKLTYVVLVIP